MEYELLNGLAFFWNNYNEKPIEREYLITAQPQQQEEEETE